MIILRQKNYTKLDKKVFNRAIKITRGGTRVPEGVKNLSARDSINFKNIGRQIDEGKEFDIEAAKSIGRKLGFSEDEVNNFEHMAKKYNTPDEKVLERFRNIHPEVKEEAEKVQKIVDRKKFTKKYKTALKDVDKDLEAELESANEKRDQLEDSIRNNSNIDDKEKLRRLKSLNRAKKSRDKRLTEEADDAKKAINKSIDKYKKQTGYAKDHYPPQIRKNLDRLKNDCFPFVLRNERLADNRILSDNEERVAKKLKQKAKKSGVVVHDNMDYNASFGGDKLYFTTTSNPSMIGHEIGHVKDNIANRRPVPEIGTKERLGAELKASKHSYALNKGELTPEELKMAEKEMMAAGGSYVTTGMHAAIDNSRKKILGIRE